MCKNIKTKDEITPGYCEAYSPSELAHCVEGFTSYTVEMDKDKYKEIYEYEYENDSLLYDSKNNKHIAKTSIEPIMYMGDQPVVFSNLHSKEKYYYDPNSGSLVSYDSKDTKSVPELINSIDYKNALNVKEKLFNKVEQCKTIVNSNNVANSRNNVANSSNNVANSSNNVANSSNSDNLNGVDDIEEEEEQYEENVPKNITESVKQVINKLDTSGFSKSFILSLIHELGSKELKVKFIEDDRDELTDKDFDKLNEIANSIPEHTHSPNNIQNNKIINVEEEEEEPENDIEKEPKQNKIYNNYSPITTTTKKPCPVIKKINCTNGSKLVYDKDGCPKIECERKIKYVSIESYDISPSTKVILYIFTIFIIVGFLVLLFMKNIIRF
jgi:hypothetical protein